MAELDRKAGRLDEAQRGIDQALAGNPKSGAAYALEAAVQTQRGLWAEALASYAKAVELTPDINEIRYNYGEALLRSGDAGDAVIQLEAAVELDDQFAPTRANLGTALARSGRLPEAIDQLQTAIALDPRYALARKNLALALVQSGDLAGAEEQYEDVLKLDPKDEATRAILTKLRNLSVPAEK